MKPGRSSLGFVLAAIVSACLLAPSVSLAGDPYTDELSKCLVRSTTDADRTLLVQWIFAMASLHPAVKSMSTLSDQQRTELSQRIAGVTEHLLTESCRNEARDAWKYEGKGAFEASFTVLGQVAGRELFASPEVAAGMSELAKFFDGDKLKAALETGK